MKFFQFPESDTQSFLPNCPISDRKILKIGQRLKYYSKLTFLVRKQWRFIISEIFWLFEWFWKCIKSSTLCADFAYFPEISLSQRDQFTFTQTMRSTLHSVCTTTNNSSLNILRQKSKTKNQELFVNNLIPEWIFVRDTPSHMYRKSPQTYSLLFPFQRQIEFFNGFSMVSSFEGDMFFLWL